MSLVYSRIAIRAGELIIGLQDGGPPTDEQWAPLMHDLKQVRAGLVGRAQMYGLVISDGGAPNAGQRAEFAKNLDGKPFRCGVLSDSTLVRGAVTAMGWFNNEMKSFSPKDSKQWIAYIPLEEPEILIARRAVAELYKKLRVTTLQQVPFLNTAL